MEKEPKGLKFLEDEKPKVQWTPAKLLDQLGGLDFERFAYRWVGKDPANLMKKNAEGWSPISTLKGDKVEHDAPTTMHGGVSLSGSLTEYRELILMRMPRELATAREEYYNKQTDGTEDALKSKITADAARAGGSVHGTISTGRRIIQ